MCIHHLYTECTEHVFNHAVLKMRWGFHICIYVTIVHIHPQIAQFPVCSEWQQTCGGMFQKAMLQFLCEMGTTMGRLLSIFISSPQYCCVQCIRMKMKHVETEHLISVLFNMADGQKYTLYIINS